MTRYSDLERVLLLPQKRSRKLPKNGDIFSLKLSTGSFLIGRVIMTNARIRYHESDYLLIYLYDRLFTEKGLDSVEEFPFDEKKLVVPPFFGLRQFWTMGYAVTLASKPVSESEVLPAHYFYDHWYKIYFDANAEEVEPPDTDNKIPVGVCGLGNLATLDLDIRKSLDMEIPDWGKNYFA